MDRPGATIGQPPKDFIRDLEETKQYRNWLEEPGSDFLAFGQQAVGFKEPAAWKYVTAALCANIPNQLEEKGVVLHYSCAPPPFENRENHLLRSIITQLLYHVSKLVEGFFIPPEVSDLSQGQLWYFFKSVLDHVPRRRKIFIAIYSLEHAHTSESESVLDLLLELMDPRYGVVKVFLTPSLPRRFEGLRKGWPRSVWVNPSNGILKRKGGYRFKEIRRSSIRKREESEEEQRYERDES
jgi:hypothetical protein